MNQLTQEEADILLDKYVKLRKKYKKAKTLEIKREFEQFQEFCAKKFDYLVEARVQAYKKFANYEDLRQDGRVALLFALNSYEPKKGNFFWWANQYIKTKVSREANRHSAMKIPIKHAKHMQPYKVSGFPTMIDASPNALDQIESDEIKQKFWEAVEKLPSDQKKILELNGIKSYSISQISKLLNISRPHCIKLLNEAKKNLKNNIENFYV